MYNLTPSIPPHFQKKQEELLQKSLEFSSYGFLLRSTLIFE